MENENKQAWGDVDLSLLDGMNPYDLFLKDPSKRKFGPKLTNALEDARSEGMELGRREGANQSLYNTVSTMLAKGADWEVIEAFTSVDEARYRELAREVACIKDPVPDRSGSASLCNTSEQPASPATAYCRLPLSTAVQWMLCEEVPLLLSGHHHRG